MKKTFIVSLLLVALTALFTFNASAKCIAEITFDDSTVYDSVTKTYASVYRDSVAFAGEFEDAKFGKGYVLSGTNKDHAIFSADYLKNLESVSIAFWWKPNGCLHYKGGRAVELFNDSMGAEQSIAIIPSRGDKVGADAKLYTQVIVVGKAVNKNFIFAEKTDSYLNSGEWYFYVITVGNGKLSVYQNGVLFCEADSHITVADVAANTLSIGTTYNSALIGTAYPATGTIDQLYLFDEVISTATMQKLMSEGYISTDTETTTTSNTTSQSPKTNDIIAYSGIILIAATVTLAIVIKKRINM